MIHTTRHYLVTQIVSLASEIDSQVEGYFFLKFKKLLYASYSWDKDKPDTLIKVFAMIFLHSATRKLVIATHRARREEIYPV